MPQPAPNQSEILLESGTNELEVLVFGVGQGSFGVNVAKVREVIMPMRATESPHSHPSVVGMFNLRGKVIPLIDLAHYLDYDSDVTPENKRIIVTEFNGHDQAFIVDRVERIHRMSWSAMKPVPESYGDQAVCLTGITELNERLILMLDFESIADHINMQDQLHVGSVDNPLGVDRGSIRVFLAEDSNFIRGLMADTLQASGYHRLSVFNNGFEAWKAFEADLAQEQAACDVLVTDIEMPQMDGLHLTRRVKEHPQLRNTTVLLFSSLITKESRHKGEQCGADEQLAKPQLPELVGIIDRWIHQKGEAQAA